MTSILLVKHENDLDYNELLQRNDWQVRWLSP